MAAIGDRIVRLLMPEWAPPVASLGVHAAILLMLTVSLHLESDNVPDSGIQTRAVIQATVVDAGAIEAEMARQAELERQLQAAADRRERERQAAVVAQQREEQAATEQARRQRATEEQRLADAQAQRQASQQAAATEAARQRQAQADAQRAADTAAQEQARLAEIRRQQQAEAERLRQLQAQQQAAEQRRQQAEAEALLQQQMAEEARRQQAESSGLLDQYKATIKQRITRNWNEPTNLSPDFYCEVIVNQIPGGEVVSVEFGTCNGDEIARRSLETAVLRSSPLPGPPPEAPELFDRRLRLPFSPSTSENPG